MLFFLSDPVHQSELPRWGHQGCWAPSYHGLWPQTKIKACSLFHKLVFLFCWCFRLIYSVHVLDLEASLFSSLFFGPFIFFGSFIFCTTSHRWALKVVAGMNPMDLKRGIDAAVKLVLEEGHAFEPIFIVLARLSFFWHPIPFYPDPLRSLAYNLL